MESSRELINFKQAKKRFKTAATDARFAARDAKTEAERKAQLARKQAIEDALSVLEDSKVE